MQTFIGPQGHADLLFLHNFEWRQQTDISRLTINGQVQDSTVFGAPGFNANSASIQYMTQRAKIDLIDFPLSVNGGVEAQVSSNSLYNVYIIRGARLTLNSNGVPDDRFRQGANQYEFFGGTTLPSYYLNLSGTRDIAGLNFIRNQSQNLSFYTTTGWVDSPPYLPGIGQKRISSFFQTAGMTYRPTSQWGVQGILGISTRGGLAEGTASYAGERFTGFASGTSSSATFPLNQLQLFFAGGSSVSAGSTLKLNGRITSSIFFEHSNSKPTLFLPIGGVSDYVNPNISFAITPQEAITLNYAYTRSSIGAVLLSRSKGQRFDVALNSRFGSGVSNTAEVTVGALSDPLQLNANGQLIAADSLSVPVNLDFSRWVSSTPATVRHLKIV